LHTGAYAQVEGSEAEVELARLMHATTVGVESGIAVHAGHGLTLDNTVPVAAIDAIEELNIGHALIADALFIGGLGAATRAYKACIARARRV
jgi:pyridoxine 5-phosphate synthase